jgi:O-antigen/teichoic acid export membrane protein
VAVRFSEVWFFISSVICASLLPAILNAHKTNYQTFLSRSKHLYFLLFYSSLVICFGVFLVAPVLIKILYGQHYLPSIGILRIYIWSIIGIFMSTALQQFLLAENKLKTILAISLIGMFISIVGNLVFIPLYGMVGAAFVNIFAYSLPFLIIIFKKEMKDQRQAVLAGLLKPFGD